MPKGKLIVIDGSDGSGKTTQTRLLVNHLRKDGRKVRFENFPQYGKKSAGLVEDYLTGQYGTAAELGAYIPSMFFAADRFAASKRIRRHLEKGYTVISNRYVTASMAHQGGKLKNKSKRQEYYKWLFDLEFNFFKIPKPDLTFILHMPPKFSLRLLKQRGAQYYIGAKELDIHEKDLAHLTTAAETYLEIVKQFKYKLIEGTENNMLLTPKQVHEKIYAILRNRN